MFDVCATWPDNFERPNRHTVDPPQPVVVDLGAILPPNKTSSRGLPMRVTQAGLELSGNRPGELLGWARVNDGRWLALVRFEVPVAAHHGVLPMLQWVPAGAVTPGAAHAYDSATCSGVGGRNDRTSTSAAGRSHK